MTVLADRYRLGHLLGRGGVAEVYRARDLVLDREVAVKMLHETVDESDRSRFEGEAKMLARLSHVGLVTVLDAGVSETRPFLVMELVEGQTLAAALREGPLPPDEVADIGAKLASTLAYAHEQEVVHRDVKPANVLLGPGRDPKLADFGIARLVGDTALHTKTGTTIGTPAYLSPEQVRGATVGPPSDVYSLGLVLLEALTGERAFTGTPIESAVARLHRAPGIPEDLPAGWRDLLLAMTATDSKDRPTAREAAAQIQLGSATPAATRVLEVPPAVPVVSPDDLPTSPIDATGRTASGGPGKWAMGGAAALVLVVLAVAGVVLSDGDGASDDSPSTPATTASPRPSDGATSAPTDGAPNESTVPEEKQPRGDGEGKGKKDDKKDDKKGDKSKGGKGKGKGKG